MVKALQIALVLFLTSLSFFHARAQGGYVEENIWSNIDPASGQASDFIFTNTGEKVFGDVITAYDFANYDKIDFDVNGKVTSFLPTDIKAFGLENGRFFMSKKLPESSDLEFVQILLSGRLQLDYKKGKYYLDNGKEIQELRTYYEDVTNQGSPKRRNIKLYVSILKINTSGICGFELQDLIERSRVDEQDFIQILTQYHECEDLPYKLHVEKIPFVRISPTASLAAGLDLTKSSDILENFNYAFSNSLSYGAFVGFRLHDFRRFPKSSVDFRIGYLLLNTTFDASIERRFETHTASEEFKESNIVIPISYNYSFIKNDFSEVYMGLVMTGKFSTLKKNLSIVEITTGVSQDKIFLYEQEMMSASNFRIMPGIKVGANFPINSKMKFFTELGVDYMKDHYNVQILNMQEFNINRTFISFQLGLEF